MDEAEADYLRQQIREFLLASARASGYNQGT